MIPLGDENPTRIFPIITISLIALNSLVFFYQLSLGRYEEAFILKYGAIPWEITHNIDRPPLIPFPIRLTLISSMFLHGGFMHLIGNMVYLWIFGNNIEEATGHLRFTIFYLICGTIAAFSHILTAPNGGIPMVGASGAISGVLGAYLILYPHARILTLIPVGGIGIVKIPALFVLGFWIILQFINGTASLGAGERGGVAWFAHVGGFIAGSILVHFFKKSESHRDERR
jgi:membrane associated rhomboid family serine protease